VKSGDTLSGIAARFATTVKAIKVANGLRDNLIRTGQVLVIP
jgi:LysM repeat protein